MGAFRQTPQGLIHYALAPHVPEPKYHPLHYTVVPESRSKTRVVRFIKFVVYAFNQLASPLKSTGRQATLAKAHDLMKTML